MRQHKTLLALALSVACATFLPASAPAQTVPGHYPGPGDRRTPPAAEATRAAPGAPALATPARPAESGTCEPSCRPGFYCKAGTCRSLCNPPCGPGEHCTEQRMCILPPPQFPYQPPPELGPPGPPPGPAAGTSITYRPVGPPMVTDEQRWQRREEEKQQRLEQRVIPRLFVGGGFGISVLGRADGASSGETADLLGVQGTAGFRKHFTPVVGIDVKLSALVGQASITAQDRPGDYLDDTGVVDVGLRAGPIFNPFSRFYLGPVAAVHHRQFGKHTLHAEGRTYTLDDGVRATVGGLFGMAFLRREQLDFNLHIGIAGEGQADIMFNAAFGFLLGD